MSVFLIGLAIVVDFIEAGVVEFGFGEAPLFHTILAVFPICVYVGDVLHGLLLDEVRVDHNHVIVADAEDALDGVGVFDEFG